jgi:pimeloyl-ACP methyl ester carboxylesterase
MGATGDCGHFDKLAELLANEFTVVSYDRRGNGRSPRPPEWGNTSPEEQADDAAALVDALELAPAAVYGSSIGANFALCLLIRHPEVVRGAVLHEPVLVRLYDDPNARGAVRALIQEGMEAGGPPAALERFRRYVAGDSNWENLEPGLRERMLASAETFFGVEVGSFENFLPDETTLAAITAPSLVLVSDGSLPVYAEAAGRLAERLGIEVTRTPGTHTAYHDHPYELAQTIRPFLRQVGEVTP